MKLKNNALQELYDTLVSGNPTFSPYAESPIDKAFLLGFAVGIAVGCWN